MSARYVSLKLRSELPNTPERQVGSLSVCGGERRAESLESLAREKRDLLTPIDVAFADTTSLYFEATAARRWAVMTKQASSPW